MRTGNPDSENEVSLDEDMSAILQNIKSRSEDDTEEDKQDGSVELKEEDPEKLEVETKEDTPDKEETEEENQTEEIEPEAKTAPDIRPPASWTAKAKADFYDLPDHIQNEVIKRESDFHTGISKYKVDAEFGNKLKSVIQPYEPILRAKGAVVENVVAEMLNASYQLSQGTPQDKARFLLQIARDSGADLQSLVNSGDNRPAEPQNDYVHRLEQRLAQLEGFTQNQIKSVQQREAVEVQQTVQQFAAEKDQSGRPKYQFFDDVRSDMADLIEVAERSGRKLNLLEAYEMAVWQRPDTREAMLSLQQKEIASKLNQEKALKTAQAKRRSSANVKTTGSIKAQEALEPIGSIEDTMRATLARIKGE